MARRQRPGRPAARRHRLRVPGADPHAVGDRAQERSASAEATWRAGRRGGQTGMRGDRDGRARRLRERVSARALGRHEDARVDRPRAGHASTASPAGRALRVARRDHALQARQRPAGALGQAALDRRIRDPQRVRVGLPLDAHRRHDRAPRTHASDVAIEAPAPRDEAFRTSLLYNDYCRLVSARLAEATRP